MMKHFLLRARVRYENRRLVDYVKMLHQKACSTIIFPHSTNQIVDFFALSLLLPCSNLNSLVCLIENDLWRTKEKW